MQMAPSPGSYAPSPSNLMASPMNVNMMGQRGPPSVQSVCSPNPTLNTPVMSASASPIVRPQPDEQLYREKLRQLSKYIEPLRKQVAWLENSEGTGNEKKLKIQNLLEIISDPSRRMSMETLLRCEQLLEKLEPKADGGQIPSTGILSSASASAVAQRSAGQPPSVGHRTERVYDQNICQPLLDAVRANLKKPYFNHTLQRTFAPAVATICRGAYELGDLKERKLDRSGFVQADRLNEKADRPDEQLIPHVVQGELAKLERKFRISLDPLQYEGSRTWTLLCHLESKELPCVPPIQIKLFANYPDMAPLCALDAGQYQSSGFLRRLHTLFTVTLDRLPVLHSFSAILDRWVSTTFRQSSNRFESKAFSCSSFNFLIIPTTGDVGTPGDGAGPVSRAPSSSPCIESRHSTQSCSARFFPTTLSALSQHPNLV